MKQKRRLKPDHLTETSNLSANRAITHQVSIKTGKAPKMASLKSIVITMSSCLAIFSFITSTQCQQQGASRSSNNNVNLVSLGQMATLASQSLTRQAQDSALDNAIESTPATTTNLAYQQSNYQTCHLPPTWMGKWYQSNKEPIRVTSREISDKGLCRDKKGDKYLFENVRQQCLVCLVINERHLNVLQYKESNCQPIPARYMNRSTNGLLVDEDHSLLETICSDITGDAQLESLFRLDAPATECPISGKYHFTYDNCREPRSSLESCIDKKQLNFKFAACPDVPGSESKSK